MPVRIAITILTVLWSLGFAQKALPVRDGARILFIGNSLTRNEGGLDNYVEACGAAANPPFTFVAESETKLSTRLYDLYNETNAVERILTGNYDVVVLQGYLDVVQDVERFFEAVRMFHAVIDNAGSQAMLFMHWPFTTQDPYLYTTILRDMYDVIGNELGIPVALAGQVWHQFRQQPPPGESQYLLYADPLHQNAIGSALNAYVFYAELTRRNPIGIHFTYGEFNISAELNSYLTTRTWSVLTHHWELNSSQYEGVSVIRGLETPRSLVGNLYNNSELRKFIPVDLLGRKPPAPAAALQGAGLYLTPLSGSAAKIFRLK